MFLLLGPSAPEQASWAASGPGAIKLQWKPPKQKNGVIVSYVIKYSRNVETNDDYWYSKKENGKK